MVNIFTIILLFPILASSHPTSFGESYSQSTVKTITLPETKGITVAYIKKNNSFDDYFKKTTKPKNNGDENIRPTRSEYANDIFKNLANMLDSKQYPGSEKDFKSFLEEFPSLVYEFVRAKKGEESEKEENEDKSFESFKQASNVDIFKSIHREPKYYEKYHTEPPIDVVYKSPSNDEPPESNGGYNYRKETVKNDFKTIVENMVNMVKNNGKEYEHIIDSNEDMSNEENLKKFYESLNNLQEDKETDNEAPILDFGPNEENGKQSEDSIKNFLKTLQIIKTEEKSGSPVIEIHNSVKIKDFEVDTNTKPPVIQKHIYVHVAPPDSDEEEEEETPTQEPVKTEKHYKIIFVKVPNQKNPRPPVPQIPTKEEKTLVYVLVKKPEKPARNLPSAEPTLPTKPEVFYVQYQNKNKYVNSSDSAYLDLSLHKTNNHAKSESG